MKVSSFGQSETGLVRSNNEDVWGGIVNENFFVLADGMGGHMAGEVAARETVNNLSKQMGRLLKEHKKITLKQMTQSLKQTIKDVNTEIFIMSTASEDLRGMGTTLCCLYLMAEGAVIGHVGDSRIYRFRKSKLSLLTHDHSLIAELVDTGRWEEEYEEEQKYKNIITKAIGTDPIVEPDVVNIDLQAGDLFLLCSDGLTDLLSDDEIEKTIIAYTSSEVPNLSLCANQLIKKSLSKGGVDNTTIFLIFVESL